MVTYNCSVSCLIRYQITNKVPRQPGRPLSSAANTQLSGSLSKSEHDLAVPAERVQSVLQLVQGLRRQRLLAPQLVEALAEELVPARHLRRKEFIVVPSHVQMPFRLPFPPFPFCCSSSFFLLLLVLSLLFLLPLSPVLPSLFPLPPLPCPALYCP